MFGVIEVDWFGKIVPIPLRAVRPTEPEIKVIALYKDVGPLGRGGRCFKWLEETRLGG